MMPASRKPARPGYPRGVCPTARRFALTCQLALLQAALAPWPRRQAPLLEVNCGNGVFLPFLWQWGFDVQATEEDPVLRQRARASRAQGIDVRGASDADLPFASDSFDWVIIHLKGSAEETVRRCANEGARLARRGMLLAFWNSNSLPAWLWHLFHKTDWMPGSVSWRLVWRQAQALRAGRVTTLSTLAAPACAWRHRLPGVSARMNAPIGAWCLVRIDMGPAAPLTPLAMRLGVTMPNQAEPAMEYAQKPPTREAVDKS